MPVKFTVWTASCDLAQEFHNKNGLIASEEVLQRERSPSMQISLAKKQFELSHFLRQILKITGLLLLFAPSAKRTCEIVRSFSAILFA